MADINVNSNCSHNVKVIGGGAWQKMGYSPLNGVATLISDGKCIDTEVLSKKCKQCEQWKHINDTVEYSNWKEKHICAINHTGSAGTIEVVGLKRIFHRSECLHNLRYTFYVGDGDTKSFDKISKSNPYPGHTITKGESIGEIKGNCGEKTF